MKINWRGSSITMPVTSAMLAPGNKPHDEVRRKLDAWIGAREETTAGYGCSPGLPRSGPDTDPRHWLSLQSFTSPSILEP